VTTNNETTAAAERADEQISRDLAEAGIDMTEPNKRLHAMIDAAKQKQLSPPDTLAAAEIEATWRLIENEYDIEPRAQIEAEAKTNGFKYGLAQAIHTIWKRDPKVADLASAEKLLADMAEAFRTGHTIYPTSDYAMSVAEIADRLAAQLSPPDTLTAAAEEAVKRLRSSAVTLDSINRISDAQESIAIADRLAAELEKRGRA